MLLRHALTELKKKKLPSVWLTVKRENTAARSLYEKEGFICTVPESYREHMPDLMYEKRM